MKAIEAMRTGIATERSDPEGFQNADKRRALRIAHGTTFPAAGTKRHHQTISWEVKQGPKSAGRNHAEHKKVTIF
jgi:hypothetical protein